MFEKSSVRRRLTAVVVGAMLVAVPAWGQDSPKKGVSVPITFVPPPIENATYSVGIYDVKSGKLARRLCEAAGQNTFTVGLNGLITSWDGKDDDGKPLPPSKYAARGYAAGPLEVEGEAVLDNDWAQEDENLRVCKIEGIGWVPADDGFCIVAIMAGGGRELIRFTKEGKLVWRKPIDWKELSKSDRLVRWRLVPNALSLDVFAVGIANGRASFRIADGSSGPTPADAPDLFADESHLRPNDPAAPRPLTVGMDRSVWAVNYRGLYQLSAAGEVKRMLPHEKVREPEPSRPNERGFKRVLEWRPFLASASTNSELLYLLEGLTDDEATFRVRGISLKETKDEEGKRLSTWQTFVQREIRRPDPLLGLEEVATVKVDSSPVEIVLAENPLTPGKHERARLLATFDEKGSYLSTADGLRLRQVSERGHLRAVKLAKGNSTRELTLLQTDGAAVDEFSIDGIKAMIAFDAGEFEIDAAGEKPNAEKAPEPDL